MALGLVIAVVAWLLAIRAIAWSFNRQVAAVVTAGLPVEDRFRHISMKDVARYHSLGWTLSQRRSLVPRTDGHGVGGVPHVDRFRGRPTVECDHMSWRTAMVDDLNAA